MKIREAVRNVGYISAELIRLTLGTYACSAAIVGRDGIEIMLKAQADLIRPVAYHSGVDGFDRFSRSGGSVFFDRWRKHEIS